jgi:hypothetical protein
MPDIFESVVRADDFFYCQFELVNLTLGSSATGAPQLKRVAAGPAHIVLRLPPQSVAEQVTLTGLPSQSGLSGPSRLTFRVPDNVDTIDYRLDALLAFLQTADLETTDPHTGLPIPLTGLATAIECPDRLLLMPPSSSRLAHRTTPFTSPGAVTELWHSTLHDPASGDVSLLRPIANPADATDRPFPTALKKADRDGIRAHSQPGNPNVIASSLLRFSALGATMRLKGDWPPSPPPATLAAWEHQAELGRDEYVLTVNQGYLFPFGHRASIANITQRTAESGVAELKQDSVLTILEPEQSYDNLAAYPAHGREMPFLQVRVVSGSQTVGSDVGLSRVPVKVDLLLTDRAHNHVDCKEASVFFVPAGSATDLGVLGPVSRLYQPLSTLALAGQRVVIADNPDGLGDTALIIDSMMLGVKLPPSDLAAQIVPAFLPYMVAANARIPALEQMVGTSDPTPASKRQPSSIVFHDAYLRSGFDKNGVFAKFAPIALAIPPERAGGLAAPTFPGIDGLSRLTGPVSGVENLVNGGPLNAAQLIGNDARLLGAISLKEVIADVAGGADPFPAAAAQNLFDTIDNVAGLVPRPVITTVPTAIGVETRFVWKPQIKAAGPLQTNPGTSLVLKGRITAGVRGSSAFSVQGTLSNFALSLLGLVTVRFNSMQFVSQSGSKVDLKLGIAGVGFDGSLKFVEKLQELLPTTSLGTLPQVQTLPDGVTVRYAIPIPSVPLGIMNIENLLVSTSVSIPFVAGKAAAVQFALSQRDNPFQINVSIFGGTGFFSIVVSTDGHLAIEAAIEFGGVAELDLVVVKGGVHLLVGVYLSMSATDVAIEGHLRLGGYVDVLGLVGVSIDFYLGLTYDKTSNVLAGTGRLTVGIKLLFHTESFSFTIHREIPFGGAPSSDSAAMHPMIAAAPHFRPLAAAAPAMTSTQWDSYCRAFA